MDISEPNDNQLNDIEAALLSIEGLAEAIYELSGDGVSKRRFSAIGSVAGHLLVEVKRAREMVQSNLLRHPGQA